MKKNYFLSFLFCLFLSKTFAQKVELTVIAKAEKSENIEFANLLIRNTKDSSLAWSATFQENGKLIAQLKANQTYWLSISALGLNTHNQQINITKSNQTVEVMMQTATTALQEVTVKFREKLIRQEDDKEIVDSEALAKLSTNAFELLEKIPGVFVIEDNIFLGKAEAARIYINGREMKLGSKDLASILKSMPPNAVQKIELLRTPSAKYDASSTGGIINIVLKKGVRLGTNGSVNATLSQGKYARGNAGISINHGDAASTVYFNYQYNARNGFEELNSQRFFANSSQLIQEAFTTFPTQTHYFAAGIDKQLGEKWNIANDFITNFDNSQSLVDNTNTFEFLNKNEKISESKAIFENTFKRYNINNTLSLQKKLDTVGGEWNTAFNYIFSNNTTAQVFTNSLVFPKQTQSNGDGNIAGNRHVFAFTSDFTKKLAYKIKLETGAKIDFLTSNSNSVFNIGAKKDPNNSVTYDYRENINALYAQVSRPFNKTNVKTGIRLENTNMLGNQTMPNDTNFTVKRTDFFPYLYVSRNLFTPFKGFTLTGNLIARRSITRPGYEALNPAIQFTDPYFLQSGNPSLKPQFTNTYEFNISYNSYPVLALGTDETKDVFSKVVYQNPTTNVFTETYDNLGNLRQYYARLVGGMPPGGKYFIVVGGMYNYQIYKGLYQGEQLDFRRGSWSVFSYQELKIGKNTRFSANVFFRLKGVQNFYELKNLGDLTVTLRHNFPKQKIQLILRGGDIFYTMPTEFTIRQGGINATGRRANDSQRVGLTVRYDFGVRIAEKKKKESGENVFDMVNPAKQKVQ